jgi:hypothetical protein
MGKNIIFDRGGCKMAGKSGSRAKEETERF